MTDDFQDFVDMLTENEQPICNIDSPDDCEACGS